MGQTFIYMHDEIYFLKYISHFSSKTPTQHDAATTMIHSWDGVLQIKGFMLFAPYMAFTLWLLLPDGQKVGENLYFSLAFLHLGVEAFSLHDSLSENGDIGLY